MTDFSLDLHTPRDDEARSQAPTPQDPLGKMFHRSITPCEVSESCQEGHFYSRLLKDIQGMTKNVENFVQQCFAKKLTPASVENLEAGLSELVSGKKSKIYLHAPAVVTSENKKDIEVGDSKSATYLQTHRFATVKFQILDGERRLFCIVKPKHALKGSSKKIRPTLDVPAADLVARAIIHGSSSSSVDHLYKKWMDEVEMATRLIDAHPHGELYFARAHHISAVNSEKNCIYGLMKLYQQGDLENYLASSKSKLADWEVLGCVRHLADGVNIMHEQGILHGDIKPANIFVDEGIPRLGDFGETRTQEEALQADIHGTASFMSPEYLEAIEQYRETTGYEKLEKLKAAQCLHKPALDVYAFACSILMGCSGYISDRKEREKLMNICFDVHRGKIQSMQDFIAAFDSAFPGLNERWQKEKIQPILNVT